MAIVFMDDRDKEELINKNNITLGLHTDGLIYLFINGEAVGNGIALPGGESGDVVGNVDSANNIVLSGNLADGTYTLKYEMEDGSTIDIGDLVIDSEISTYYITNNLTNCTNENSVESITEGESYSATISANDGYSISSVVVTMGGTDITASAVSGSNINIASVTGDIVITAVAEEAESELKGNLADPTSADWQEGYRLSISSGGTQACEGHISTNYIPAKMGDILRVKGLNITTSINDQYAKIVKYAEDKTAQSGLYGVGNGSIDGYADYVTVNGDISTYTIMIRNDGLQRADSSTAYIRIDGIPIDGYTSDDIIITINEEIVEPVNQIPISTNADGSLFVGTNGEAGYKTGYRIKSSTGGEEAIANYECVGFIPVSLNDTVYIKGITISANDGKESIAFYDSNKNYISGVYFGGNAIGVGLVSGEVASFVVNSSNNLNLNDSVAFMRFSAQVIDDDSIVTINQPIK